jgi:hypothetical protein
MIHRFLSFSTCLLQIVFCMTTSLFSLSELPELPSLPSLPDVSKSTKNSSPSALLPPAGATLSSPGLSSVSGMKKSVLETSSPDISSKDAKGSWFKKRHWLLKAREQQDKINILLVSIQDVGAPQYDSKRAAFDKDADAFYAKIGFGKGQVEALLEDLAPYFDMNVRAKGTLASQKLEASLSSSKNYQKYYDTALLQGQLKSDLSAIADIESALDSRIEQFHTIIQQASAKALEAQKIVNDLFSMINHEAARESYYRLEGITAYLEAVLKFVKVDLAADVDKVIALGKGRMDEVAKVVTGIKNVCEELKKDLESQDKKVSEEKDAQGEPVDEKTVEQPTHTDVLNKSEDRSFFGILVSYLVAFWNFLTTVLG